MPLLFAGMGLMRPFGPAVDYRYCHSQKFCLPSTYYRQFTFY